VRDGRGGGLVDEAAGREALDREGRVFGFAAFSATNRDPLRRKML
jgi:hypothetical protein